MSPSKKWAWDKGIDTIYSYNKGGTVFITPPVNDWTFDDMDSFDIDEIILDEDTDIKEPEWRFFGNLHVFVSS